jgi:hypothetical protein
MAAAAPDLELEAGEVNVQMLAAMLDFMQCLVKKQKR